MTSDQKRDSLFCGLALVIAVTVGIVSFGYRFESSYFPRLLSIFIGVLAAGLWIRVLTSDSQGNAEKRSKNVRVQLLGTAKIVAAVLAYVAAIQITNYVIATLTFLFMTMVILGERRVVRLSLVAIGVTGLLYYLFFVFLGVTPPEGLMSLS